MKPKIVLSGVNFTEMGPLTVFTEAITSLKASHGDTYDIVALVHRKSLFDIPGITYMEYPEIKSSWLNRLRFEYRECKRISEELKPHLWLAMHDMTPNVTAKIRAVYCHNPSPFYAFSMKEAQMDWRFGLFTLFYSFLYRINIRANDFVIVQQNWLRSKFRTIYGVKNVIVAHPLLGGAATELSTGTQKKNQTPYTFFYPAFPRTFKNIEQVLAAARKLQQDGFRGFEVRLTIDGTENSYAEDLRRKYADVESIHWLGLLPRAEILKRYADADCLLFPSKLETWGMPITEFKATGKPILVADLPYAHESADAYDQCAFFDTKDVNDLAEKMRAAATGEPVFHATSAQCIEPPFARNWEELWEILLHSAH